VGEAVKLALRLLRYGVLTAEVLFICACALMFGAAILHRPVESIARWLLLITILALGLRSWQRLLKSIS